MGWKHSEKTLNKNSGKEQWEMKQREKTRGKTQEKNIGRNKEVFVCFIFI